MRAGLVVTWLLAALPAQAECRIKGRQPSVEVMIGTGARRFSVTVRGWSMTARLPSPATTGAQPVALEGGLRFEGEIERGQLPLVLERAVTAAGGLAGLPRGAALRVAWSQRDGAAADVALAPGVLASAVALPCDAIAMAPLHGVARPPAFDPGARWMPRRHQLALRRGRQRLVVRVERPADLPLRADESRGPWMHVRWGHGDGAAIDGWAARADLRPLAPRGALEGNAVAEARPGAGDPPPHQVSADGYRGPARIAAETPVYQTPFGVRWATVVDDRDVMVELERRDAEWVALVRVPGLSEPSQPLLRHAWVRRAAVRLPAP